MKSTVRRPARQPRRPLMCSPTSAAPSTTRRLTKDREPLVCLLRLSGRALGPSAHLKPDRERICDGASSNRADQGSPRPRPPSSWCSNSSTPPGNMAAIKGENQLPKVRPRRQIPKRHRGQSIAGSPRRLIDPRHPMAHGRNVSAAGKSTGRALRCGLFRVIPASMAAMTQLYAELDADTLE